ncbi:UDP-N-acetylmuramate dehydrogenase [Candidatus Desulforudis audaxviator]|uniref:UDP-N-acetylenolpyruvoylglucosamine reductase n=1 Tax=Desulforudis audaxviator (strain MP104C) TaxID=477974 RepID=B1I4C2_DESAP|nr:UDP-N-acetylmuramate dehydrogenase [Candidatus Desulforudis audaxviator]ACA59941.1 UDP-N-acetylenolpyruvoylglucosamine reductase [Candidatus Desulforudis audaxviator MP104C]AZK59955.1 UDP-N-acetylenolpyruvoylglucosamine reductase [Candidatus Desulforudis audaxviator]
MEVYLDLKAGIRGSIRVGEMLGAHTTWRVGGPADYFVEPAVIEDLQFVLRFTAERGLPLTVMGNGSNLLVSDAGLRGVVVRMGSGMDRVVLDGNVILAQGGVRLSRLLRTAWESGLGGLEFMAGIPASLGGAVVMNAGANGLCMGDRVEEVTMVDRSGTVQRRSAGELGFRYRWSNIQAGKEIVTAVALRCFPKDRDEIGREIERFLNRRRETQPLEQPSAGCVFKNPPGDSAGRLIEAAGGKGLRVGGAEVSYKHANFVLNTGGATARDIMELIRQVRQLVGDKFGIELGLEVNLMGDF